VGFEQVLRRPIETAASIRQVNPIRCEMREFTRDAVSVIVSIYVKNSAFGFSSHVGIHSGNHLELPSMTCPNCGKEMTDWTLDGRLGTQITVDVCTGCRAFWFDQHKSLQLSPGSTLKLMKFIGEHSSTVKPTLSDVLRCPRCGGRLSLAHDLVRNMRFSYWGCASEHGRFIGFFDFLKRRISSTRSHLKRFSS
jgi:Transcription factor zinc-finger